MIETPIAGVDDLEDVSPHTEPVDVVVLTLPVAVARTLYQVLDVIPVDDDDEPHIAVAFDRIGETLGVAQ